MLDWFRGQLPLIHTPLQAGRVLSIEPNGEIEWITIKKVRVANDWGLCSTGRSSHETSLQIRSIGGNGAGLATDLQIDGNLAKFVQGHNVFGTNDLQTQMRLAFEKILEIYPDLFDELNITRCRNVIKEGDYLTKMIDINEMFDLHNDASVEAWLHAAEMVARSRSGRACRDKGTVYLGKNSRRWCLKFYNKFRELGASGRTHALPQFLADSGLREFSEGKLRAELRLQSMQLKDFGVTHGKHVTETWINNIFNEFLGRVEMNAQAVLFDTALLELPRSVQSSYQLWRQGVTLKDMLPRNTFYRHRKILLEHSIDITCPPSSPDRQNVIPLIKTLEATPVAIPDWAYQNNLIAI